MINIASILANVSINNIAYFSLLIGLLFQIAPNNKIFHYFKLFFFLGFSFWIENNLNLDQLQKTMLIGIGSSFALGSFLLKNEELKNISLLKFLYFTLVFLFILTKNELHIFIILEILAIIGFIFIVIENYENSKNIALRYVITHFFVGMILLCGLAFDSYGISIIAKPFLLSSLLINCAIPPFSFWLIQAYSQVNFALAAIMMAVITKLSLYLLFKVFAGEDILLYIGLVTIIYSGLMLLNEMNIKKFFFHSLIIHNGFFLIAISFLNKSDIIQFSQLMLASFFSQILFTGLISVIIRNQSSFYFMDLEHDIKHHKFLFILSIVINYIFIAMPLSPMFIIKSEIFTALTNSTYQAIIYLAIIMTIIAHLYIFHYKIFVKKNTMLKNRFQSKKNNIFLLLLLLPVFYISWKSLTVENFTHYFDKKYFEFIIVSGVVFVIFHRFLYKNHSNLLDFDFLILLFKKQFNYLFIRYKILQYNTSIFHDKLVIKIDNFNHNITSKEKNKYLYSVIFIVMITTISLLIV